MSSLLLGVPIDRRLAHQLLALDRLRQKHRAADACRHVLFTAPGGVGWTRPLAIPVLLAISPPSYYSICLN